MDSVNLPSPAHEKSGEQQYTDLFRPQTVSEQIQTHNLTEIEKQLH